ncbi:MAG TPA: pantetheine-phosphate adenylyltransferase [Nitriliruptorales bacterium]|nr:pantetheine-phosphate adenylyltransferase [Nitriliruptorales bacterium]
MTVSAVYPGSFDPITYGHLDIIERAASRFDRLVVAVLQNPAKQALFAVDDRVRLIRETVDHIDNVRVERFQGLLVHFCHQHGIRVIVKGLRAVSDFEYELQMAQMNHRLGDVETLLMPTNPEWSYLSSSLVKEVARFGGRVDGVVPDKVAAALAERFS